MKKTYKEIYDELAKLVPTEIVEQLGESWLNIVADKNGKPIEIGKERLKERFHKDGDAYKLAYIQGIHENRSFSYYPKGTPIEEDECKHFNVKRNFIRGDVRLVDAPIKTNAVGEDTIIQTVITSKPREFEK